MKNEEILILAKAGFTAQQIAALSAAGLSPSPVPTQERTAPPVPNTGNTDFNTQIMAELGKIQSAVQAGAIAGSQLQVGQRTTDQILAEILDPPKPEREGK